MWHKTLGEWHNFRSSQCSRTKEPRTKSMAGLQMKRLPELKANPYHSKVQGKAVKKLLASPQTTKLPTKLGPRPTTKSSPKSSTKLPNRSCRRSCRQNSDEVADKDYSEIHDEAANEALDEAVETRSTTTPSKKLPAKFTWNRQ